MEGGANKENHRKNALNPSRICEIGCGAGEILNQLAIQYPGKEFYGYKISPQAFDRKLDNLFDNNLMVVRLQLMIQVVVARIQWTFL